MSDTAIDLHIDLKVVLDTMLPGDEALGMPPASSLDFELYQLRHGATAEIERFLVVLAGVVDKKFGQPFDTLDAAQRMAAINGCKVTDVRAFSAFVNHALRAYYTDRAILQRLSTDAVPPFPAGNQLDDDDWTLLEPVYERGPIWRGANLH